MASTMRRAGLSFGIDQDRADYTVLQRRMGGRPHL